MTRRLFSQPLIKLAGVLLLTGLIVAGCLFWLFFRPVEIVAVHKDGAFSAVLVRNFPFTDRGKINWWLENSEMLKAKYNIPKPASDGAFSMVFWDYGDGYKEEGKYDRRCFADMKPPVNCIDKNSLLMVNDSKNTGVFFSLSSGTYRIEDNSKGIKNTSNYKIIKIKGYEYDN